MLYKFVDTNNYNVKLQYPFRTKFFSKWYVAASNRCCAVLVPIDMVNGAWKYDEHIDMIENVTTEAVNCNQTYTRERMKEVLDAFPKKDIYTQEDKDCDKCNGTGEVEWECKSWTLAEECPVCRGDGVIAGPRINTEKKEYDTYYCLQISQHPFYAERLQELYDLANAMEADPILIYQNEGNKASQFQVGEAIMLLMPISKGTNIFAYL